MGPLSLFVAFKLIQLGATFFLSKSPTTTKNSSDSDISFKNDLGEITISKLPECQDLLDAQFELLKIELNDTKEGSIQKIEEIFHQIGNYYIVCSNFNNNDTEIAIGHNSFIVNKIADIIIKDYTEYIEKISDKNDKSVDKLEKIRNLLIICLRTEGSYDLIDYYFQDINQDKVDLNNTLLMCYDNIFDITDGHIKQKEIRSYDDLLGVAGKTYKKLIDKLAEFNINVGNRNLSDEIVYEIASTIKDNTKFYFTKGLSVNSLAKDIMDSMIDYLHNSIPKIIFVDSNEPAKTENLRLYGVKETINHLFARYLGNRKIKNYYYYLKMCCKIRHCLMESGLLEKEEFKDCIKKVIDENLLKYRFPGVAKDTIKREVEDYYKELYQTKNQSPREELEVIL